MGDHMRRATEDPLAHLQVTRNRYKKILLGATLRVEQRIRTMLQQCSHGGCALGYAFHVVRQQNH